MSHIQYTIWGNVRPFGLPCICARFSIDLPVQDLQRAPQIKQPHWSCKTNKKRLHTRATANTVINYYWVRSPSKSPRSSSCLAHSLVISAEGIRKYFRQLLPAQCSEMFSSNQEWNSSEDTFSFAKKKNYKRANEAISKDVPTPFFHLGTQKHIAEYAMWKDTLWWCKDPLVRSKV